MQIAWPSGRTETRFDKGIQGLSCYGPQGAGSSGFPESQCLEMMIRAQLYKGKSMIERNASRNTACAGMGRLSQRILLSRFLKQAGCAGIEPGHVILHEQNDMTVKHSLKLFCGVQGSFVY